jgi:hypothetical protein
MQCQSVGARMQRDVDHLDRYELDKVLPMKVSITIDQNEYSRRAGEQV